MSRTVLDSKRLVKSGPNRYAEFMNETQNACIFCKIIKKEIPAEIVYEDSESLAFLDINPVNEGHTLLIPKEHHAYMMDTPDEIVTMLFQRAKELMIGVKRATKADFVVLTVVGNDVPHFHIHLIPRLNNDGLGGFWKTKKYENNAEMRSMGESIRTSLENTHN